MMWSEKHRPRSMADMVGNEEARAKLVEWFEKWKRGSKPLLLVGPPGTGKTTIAHLSGNRFGYDVIGLNASDARSKSRINDTLGPVMGNSGVMGSPMVFVDEVDGIHGRADFGGADALSKLLKDAPVPILMAANSMTSRMSSIAKASIMVEFRPVPPRLMRAYLRHVLSEEGASLSPGSEIKIIGQSRGDMRSMINLAQSLVTGFDPHTAKSPGTLAVEDGVELFFAAETAAEAQAILRSLQADPRTKINAFYSSVITGGLPRAELSRMLQVLSDADILYGRIFRTQQWRLLRYLDNILLRLFGSSSKLKHSPYNLPWPLLNRIRWDGRALKKLFLALGSQMHLSSGRFGTLCFPFMLSCIRNGVLELALEEDLAKILDKEVARQK